MIGTGAPSARATVLIATDTRDARCAFFASGSRVEGLQFAELARRRVSNISIVVHHMG